MADEREHDPRARRDDEKVQEEIRRLFARYRRIARRAAQAADHRPRDLGDGRHRG
jgi:hypothetical protein